MQIYPNILGQDAVKDSRQMLLDRDDSLKTNFSGSTPPTVTYADLGVIWFNTEDRQFYGLVDINEDGTNATWQKVANVSRLNVMDLGTPTEETLFVDLVGQPCDSKEDMFVFVEHTVLPMENYEITHDGLRITFVSPIPANLKLELRWFTKTIIGRDGATFVPTITNKVLTWDNDQELPNPEPLDFGAAEADVVAQGQIQVAAVQAEGNKQVEYVSEAAKVSVDESIQEYNDNVTTKTNEFNTNASTTLSVYNTNDVEKTEAYNNNAREKQAAVDASAANALASENNAKASEEAALQYQSNAEDWASKIDGEVVDGEYSAKAWAIGGMGTETNNAKYWAEQAQKASGFEDATEATKGVIALATEEEAIAGIDDTKAITPLKLQQVVSGFDALPSQEEQAGKYLTTDGTNASWGEIEALNNKMDREDFVVTTSLPSNPLVGKMYYILES